MSLILALSAEDLMPPGFVGGGGAAADPTATLRCPHAWSEDTKYCLKNSAVIMHSPVIEETPDASTILPDPATFAGLNPRGEAAFGYTIPNLLIDHAMRNPHVPPGFWRGVNINHDAIYVECFMDKLDHSVGQDPLEFLRKLMANHPKHVLGEAAINSVRRRCAPATTRGQSIERGKVAVHASVQRPDDIGGIGNE